MAIIAQNGSGVLIVNSTPTHTPLAGQAKLALDITRRGVLYYFTTRWDVHDLRIPITFNGDIIPNRSNLTNALQALETAVEGIVIPPTDLSIAYTFNSVFIESSTGSNVIIPEASRLRAGLMSVVDKFKLDTYYPELATAFLGSTIPLNSNVHIALQSLETAIEGKVSEPAVYDLTGTGAILIRLDRSKVAVGSVFSLAFDILDTNGLTEYRLGGRRLSSTLDNVRVTKTNQRGSSYTERIRMYRNSHISSIEIYVGLTTVSRVPQALFLKEFLVNASPSFADRDLGGIPVSVVSRLPTIGLGVNYIGQY